MGTIGMSGPKASSMARVGTIATIVKLAHYMVLFVGLAFTALLLLT